MAPKFSLTANDICSSPPVHRPVRAPSLLPAEDGLPPWRERERERKKRVPLGRSTAGEGRPPAGGLTATMERERGGKECRWGGAPPGRAAAEGGRGASAGDVGSEHVGMREMKGQIGRHFC